MREKLPYWQSAPMATISARSCQEAFKAIQRHTPSVVACEGELPDGSWKDLVSQVHDLETPPPVVVMSRHADERFWAEVLNLGGYDVLAKPLERMEVSRVMRAAWRHGRTA
jgi:DNA-binding NtrC family response regulator